MVIAGKWKRIDRGDLNILRDVHLEIHEKINGNDLKVRSDFRKRLRIYVRMNMTAIVLRMLYYKVWMLNNGTKLKTN